jgi:hypothetical protein
MILCSVETGEIPNTSFVLRHLIAGFGRDDAGVVRRILSLFRA